MKEYHLTVDDYMSIPWTDRNGKYIVENHGIFYCKNGFPHREDGPACEYPNGYKDWRINGKHHRLDGPAIIHSDNTVYYFINDKFYSSKEEYEIAVYLYKHNLEVYE